MGQLPDAPQDTFCPLAARALWTHVELAVDQDPQVPYHGTTLPHPILQSVHTSRVALSQVKNPALAFVKLRMVGSCPALSFIKVS